MDLAGSSWIGIFVVLIIPSCIQPDTVVELSESNLPIFPPLFAMLIFYLIFFFFYWNKLVSEVSLAQLASLLRFLSSSAVLIVYVRMYVRVRAFRPCSLKVFAAAEA